MTPLTLLVLASPDDPLLPQLARLPAETRVVVGKTPEAFGDGDAILVWQTGRRLLEPVWRKARGVRWIHVSSAGLDHLLFPDLAASAVTLTNARGAYSGPLGEWALGAVLYFAKDFRRLLRAQAEGRWDPFDVQGVRGRTLGIVGYGDIGRAVAERARAVGMRVIALRRRPELSASDPLLDRALPVAALPELMAASDYVVVAAPLTGATRGLVNEAAIAAMKPGGVLINVGRGKVIDEAALVRALEAGRIRGAALDVFEKEPLPAGHPLYRLENVLLSPHSADHVEGWLDTSMEIFLENFERFRKGEPLKNVVNKQAGY